MERLTIDDLVLNDVWVVLPTGDDVTKDHVRQVCRTHNIMARAV